MFKYILPVLLSCSVACQTADILKADIPQDALFQMKLSSVHKAIKSLECTLEGNLENKSSCYWAWLLSLAHTRFFTDNFENFLEKNNALVMQEEIEVMNNPAKLKLLEQAMSMTNLWEQCFTACSISSIRYTPSDKKENEHIIQSFKWLVVAALLDYDFQDNSCEVLFRAEIFYNINIGILQKGMQEAKAWLKAHSKYNRAQYVRLEKKIALN